MPASRSSSTLAHILEHNTYARTHTDWCRLLASIKYRTSHAFHISYTNDGDASYVLVDYSADRIYCLSTMPMKLKRFEYFGIAFVSSFHSHLAILLHTKNGSRLNNKMKKIKSDHIEPVHNASMHCKFIQGLWMHSKFHINMLIISVSSPPGWFSSVMLCVAILCFFFSFSLYNKAIWAFNKNVQWAKERKRKKLLWTCCYWCQKNLVWDRDMKWNNDKTKIKFMKPKKNETKKW